MAAYVKTNKSTDQMLNELSAKRKKDESVVKFKQDIVAEAVESLYKKEIKRAK